MIFNRKLPEPETVAEASLASLRSSVNALRFRHAELTMEIGVRQDELDEVAAQLRILEPALGQLNDPFAVEQAMKEITFDD